MAIGSVSRPDAGQERRRAELAERDRRREPGADQQRPAQGADVDLATTPAAATRRACAAARAGPGAIARSDRQTARARRTGMATSAWPSGTSHHAARQSNGARVEGDQHPEADGHRRRAERQHQAGVEQLAEPS